MKAFKSPARWLAGIDADAAALLDKINMDKRDGHKKFNADNH